MIEYALVKCCDDMSVLANRLEVGIQIAKEWGLEKAVMFNSGKCSIVHLWKKGSPRLHHMQFYRTGGEEVPVVSKVHEVLAIGVCGG